MRIRIRIEINVIQKKKEELAWCAKTITEESDIDTQGGATFRPIMKCQAPRLAEASNS